MIALIDSDLVAFRCAASAESEPEEIAILRVDKLMRDILQATEAESYLSFLTGPGNFRKQINPEYKANRKDKPLPIHLQSCRSFLIETWNTQVTEGYEADDALGMYQYKGRFAEDDTVICSLDKDLKMIPGYHYNWVKGEFDTVTTLDGIRHFWKQMLIGDKADNINGVAKIGPVKAGKLLDHVTDPKEMFWIVSDLYDSSERFWINADCLWIWRDKDVCFSQQV